MLSLFTLSNYNRSLKIAVCGLTICSLTSCYHLAENFSKSTTPNYSNSLVLGANEKTDPSASTKLPNSNNSTTEEQTAGMQASHDVATNTSSASYKRALAREELNSKLATHSNAAFYQCDSNLKLKLEHYVASPTEVVVTLQPERKNPQKRQTFLQVQDQGTAALRMNALNNADFMLEVRHSDDPTTIYSNQSAQKVSEITVDALSPVAQLNPVQILMYFHVDKDSGSVTNSNLCYLIYTQLVK